MSSLKYVQKRRTNFRKEKKIPKVFKKRSRIPKGSSVFCTKMVGLCYLRITFQLSSVRSTVVNPWQKGKNLRTITKSKEGK